MITKILNFFNTPQIRTSSQRFVSGNPPKINPRLRGIRNIHTPKAQGHDQQLFSDKSEPDFDPVTFEITPNDYAQNVFLKQNMRNSFVSSIAKNDAVGKRKITVVQKINTQNRTKNFLEMPYGSDIQQDKATNKALLLELKKRYE